MRIICLNYMLMALFVVNLYAQNSYHLSQIAKELSHTRQINNPAITASSIALLAQTKGILDFSNANHGDLASKIRAKNHLVIRIFGDSHIAGDFLSQRLRVMFFKHYHIGFAYPIYPAYHQHIGLNYESSNFEVLNSRKDSQNSDYPLGGVIAQPIELPAHIIISPKNESNEIRNTRIIFKSTQTHRVMSITDSTNVRLVINAKHANVWQNIGIKLRFPITIQALDEGLQLGGLFITDENENRIVENIGINGARSDLWRKWNEAVFARELAMLPADLTILCYGSNDAFQDYFNETLFIANFSALIDIIKSSNPHTTILLLSPPPVVDRVGGKRKKPTYKITKSFKPLKNAMYKLAKDKGVLLFDIDDFINESGGKKKWEEANLAKADVHLQPMGYKLIADKIYYELGKLK